MAIPLHPGNADGRRARALAALLALSAAMVSISAQVPADHVAAAGAPSIAFEKFTLPNGLQVILHVDRKLPVVHVNQWYHVGSKDERPGRSGFAHLFEHMMFQGSGHAPKEYFTYAEAAGANLREGGVNGTTDHDRTNYFATVPSGNLEQLLWLESDRLATLTDALTQEKLDNQKAVVRNERRQGLENAPYGRDFTLMLEALFPYRHPYANDVIGVHEDLEAATLEDVKDFFRIYYTPNNLSLAIAGDFDPAEARRLVEKYFGGIPPGPALARPPKGAPRLDGERVVEVRERVPQSRVYFAWLSPAYFDPGDAELNLATTILTDGLSARLDKALVYDRQLASSTEAFQSGQPVAGYFVLWVTARPGADLAQIEAVVGEEIARLAREGPTEAELARARTKWEFDFVTGLERIGGFGGKADLLNQYNTYLGDPGRFEVDVARHREATAAGVQRAVQTYLDTRNRVVVRFRPDPSGAPTDVQTDRSQAPPLGADRPFAAPRVQSSTLPNGLEVHVVERRELPKVTVIVASRAGSVVDPPGKSGLASLTAQVMRRGTASRDALDIDAALGDLGTVLGWRVSQEVARLDFEVLSRHLDAALGVVAEVVQGPAFPQAEVDREQQLALARLAQIASEPNALAVRTASMLAFGRDHPYGRPPLGLPGSVKALAREDLVRFHRAHWTPAATALVVAGDISLPEATELARRHFGRWTGTAAPAPAIPPARPVGPGKVFLVDRQDAAQTVVAQILPAPPRTAPDYAAMVLADGVYAGGGFGTRLNLNLREDKGYSYGVFSRATFFRQAGVVVASGGVQTDKTREAVAEFVAELKDLAGARPIADAELSAMRLVKVRGYAQQFESLRRVCDQVVSLWATGVPMDDLQCELERLQATSLAAVNAAAAKYALPGGASLLLVGDRSKIEAGVRALGLGDIVPLDVEGRPAGPVSSTAGR